MTTPAALADLDADQLRALASRLMGEVRHKQALIDKITHENAVLKRLKFGVAREHFNTEQRSLIEDTIDADIEAVQAELAQLAPKPAVAAKEGPKRRALPAHLPRWEILHEPREHPMHLRLPEDAHWPGRGREAGLPAGHVQRGAARARQVGLQAVRTLGAGTAGCARDRQGHPDGRIAGPGAGVQVRRPPAVAPSGRHLRPKRGGTASLDVGAVGGCVWRAVATARRCAQSRDAAHRVLHADETPVPMLKPGSGKTHRAYLWTYCTGQFASPRMVVYDFAESRAGKHATAFLGEWRGALVCDDYSGYKALIAQGVTEAGCLAHARRKFYELWANHSSQIAEEALGHFGKLYDVEREVRELSVEARQATRQARARPVADAMHAWLMLHRQKVPPGSATAKAIDYSLGRWAALTRYIDDGALPADNNWAENRIRPIALGRNNWLFAGSLRAGKRAAAVMSLIQSARLNGLDPWAYLKDVLQRLPAHPALRIAELLPHRWVTADISASG